MKISVVGAAGAIGSAVTFCLTQRALANEIAMVDIDSNLFEQQFLDMRTAGNARGVKITRGGFEALANSNIVVIAAAKPQPKEAAETRAGMFSANRDLFCAIAHGIQTYCPLATVIQVSNPVEPLAHIVHHLAELRHGQLLGYTLNDTLRFKSMLRRHLELNAKDRLNAVVIGEHGATKVPVFDYVFVNGGKIEISEEMRLQIMDEDWAVFPQLEYLQQLTGRAADCWSTALGVGDMVAALNAPKPVPFVCSVYLTGAYGYNDVFCGVPVKLGLGLCQEILELELAPTTKAALDLSVETIRQASATR